MSTQIDVARQLSEQEASRAAMVPQISATESQLRRLRVEHQRLTRHALNLHKEACQPNCPLDRRNAIDAEVARVATRQDEILAEITSRQQTQANLNAELQQIDLIINDLQIIIQASKIDLDHSTTPKGVPNA